MPGRSEVPAPAPLGVLLRALGLLAALARAQRRGRALQGLRDILDCRARRCGDWAMPLKKSSSNKAREQNTKEMIRAGYPPKQAVAAAYSNQRRAKKKGK